MTRAIALLLVILGISSSTAGASDAVLIAFSSDNCNYCKLMEPVLSQLESEAVAVRSVNVDHESDMAVRFNVRQLPTYVVYSGGKEASRLVGMQKIETMRQALQSVQRPPRLRNTEHSGSAPLTNLQSVQPAAPPEPMPSPSAANAVARAEAATVRLRVFEDLGYNTGTGTIVDARGDELLVVTCGHLFRDSDGKGRIEVDVFYGGEAHTVAGQLVDFNAKERDIALVSIRTSMDIQPVPILDADQQPRTGDSAFSFGCDRGALPSRRDTRITGIDKYDQHLKLSNLEIAGAPIDGRSGGGLFDSQGRLIGVCNAADNDDDVGIYAGPGEIYWQLKRIAMEQLFSGAAPTQQAAADARTAVPVQPASLQRNTTPVASNAAAGDDQEVIVIVRSRSNPAQTAKVMTFDTPPAGLMQMLQN